MQIKEVEEKTGLERSSIRFYESEGLIHPKRLDNGYREYGEEDLEALYKIKLFRSLHMTVDEIKGIFSGASSIRETLEERIRSLENEEGQIHYAKEVCMVMKNEVDSLEKLDGLKYLHLLEEKEKETGRPYYPEKEDRTPQVYAPWRRFFARILDLAFYTLLITIVRVFVFHDFLRNHNTFDNIVDTILGTVLMLLIEPLFLSKLGTTPGKAIWGLVVRREDGEYPSYQEAFTRTLGVLYYGLAFNITFLELYTLYKSYKRADEKEQQPWELGFSYRLKDERNIRPVLFVAAYGFYLLSIFFFMGYQTLPPHRGQLTLTEFSENYRYYEAYFDMEPLEQLNENGDWVEVEQDGYVIEVLNYSIKPEFQFEVDGEYLSTIYFETSIGDVDDFIATNRDYMGLAYLSAAGAEEKGRFFSALKPEDIMKEIYEKTMEDFTMKHKGVVADSTVDYRGYTGGGGFIIPQETSTNRYYKHSYKITLP